MVACAFAVSGAMEHGVGMALAGHSFGQAGDGKEQAEEAIDSSQVPMCLSWLVKEGECTRLCNSPSCDSQAGARANAAPGGGHVDEVASAISRRHADVLCK